MQGRGETLRVDQGHHYVCVVRLQGDIAPIQKNQVVHYTSNEPGITDKTALAVLTENGFNFPLRSQICILFFRVLSPSTDVHQFLSRPGRADVEVVLTI